MKSFLRFLSRRQEARPDCAAAEGRDLLQRGDRLEDVGEHAEALDLYLRAVGLMPEDPDCHFHCGNALSALGRPNEALDSYRRTVELQPLHEKAYLNLGALHLQGGSAATAEKCYRQALAIRPDSASSWTGLGCALEMKSESGAAIAAFERALELDPVHEGAASRIAYLLRANGQARAAIEILDRAQAAHPDSVVLGRAQADVYSRIGDYIRAADAYSKILKLRSGELSDFSNLLWTLNFDPEITAKEVLAEHRAYGELLRKRVSRVASRMIAPGSRLRVGYLSADFRRHSVSCFIEPLLRHHDDSKVEVHCFYDFPRWDDVTARINKLCGRWHEVSGMSDSDLAGVIRDNGIDILVDLAGHSALNRLPLFAAKPAPIQFTWLGYLCTTGLAEIDYRICDAHTDPVQVAEHWQVETPARLPDSQWCYQPQVTLPDRSPLPMLRNGYCTFGSFNQESKINGFALDAWAQVLLAVPNSRLRVVGVSCDMVEDRVRSHLANAGIAENRIELLGRIPIDSYFECYRDVDIALDSFPYNGATTTCDALIMGVPVAATLGNRAIARGGASLLTTIGLEDWIAGSPAALAPLLAAHTRDTNRLAALRESLPGRMRASPLMDGATFARNLEVLYRRAWDRACSTSELPE